MISFASSSRLVILVRVLLPGTSTSSLTGGCSGCSTLPSASRLRLAASTATDSPATDKPLTAQPSSWHAMHDQVPDKAERGSRW